MKKQKELSCAEATRLLQNGWEQKELTKQEIIKEKRKYLKVLGKVNYKRDSCYSKFFEEFEEYATLDTIFKYFENDAERIYDKISEGNKKEILKEIFDYSSQKFIMFNSQKGSRYSVSYIFLNGYLYIGIRNMFKHENNTIKKVKYSDLYNYFNKMWGVDEIYSKTEFKKYIDNLSEKEINFLKISGRDYTDFEKYKNNTTFKIKCNIERFNESKLETLSNLNDSLITKEDYINCCVNCMRFKYGLNKEEILDYVKKECEDL